jgi:hypothetical protein
MCNFKTLYQAAGGYVMRCSSCHCYQVSAGMFCLHLYEEDFVLLKNMAAEACKAVTAAKEQHIKSFALATPYPGVDILLTGNELLQFTTMLDAADTEAKALSLMSMFTCNNH